MSIRIYVDCVDTTDLFNITGTTTFRDIENQFLEITEFEGKQIYGMYNTYPDYIGITTNKIIQLGTPPRSLDGSLSQSILILTDLDSLNKQIVSMYNEYNDSELGFKYAQRNSKTRVLSKKNPFYKYTYTYKKSPNIDEEKYSSATAPLLSSLLKQPSASFYVDPDTEEVPLTFTEEDTDLIIEATNNDFDNFQICLSNIGGYEEENCLSKNEALLTKLQNAIFDNGKDLQKIISEGQSIVGVIAILNSLTTNKKGGRRKSHKKPRRKSFRKKKRICTHHSKKNVSRR